MVRLFLSRMNVKNQASRYAEVYFLLFSILSQERWHLISVPTFHQSHPIAISYDHIIASTFFLATVAVIDFKCYHIITAYSTFLHLSAIFALMCFKAVSIHSFLQATCMEMMLHLLLSSSLHQPLKLLHNCPTLHLPWLLISNPVFLLLSIFSATSIIVIANISHLLAAVISNAATSPIATTWLCNMLLFSSTFMVYLLFCFTLQAFGLLLFYKNFKHTIHVKILLHDYWWC